LPAAVYAGKVKVSFLVFTVKEYHANRIIRCPLIVQPGALAEEVGVFPVQLTGYYNLTGKLTNAFGAVEAVG